MHGQRRDEYKARFKDETISKKLEKKALTWNKISSQTLQLRKQFQTTNADATDIDPGTSLSNKVALGLTENLLSVNPDPVYLWNHRREILLDAIRIGSESGDEVNEDAGADAGADITMTPSEFIRQEQILTETALKRNPKSYGAWFHRKWSIRHYLSLLTQTKTIPQTADQTQPPTETTEGPNENDLILKLLQSELILCGQFLMLDERNFHCWNYRRFVVGILMAVSLNRMDAGLDGSWDVKELLKTEEFKQGDDGVNGNGSVVPIFGAQLNSSSGTTSSDTEIQESANRQGLEKLHQLLKSEMDFTTEKIEQNFSNGSAFHQRSKILPILFQVDSCSSSSSSSSSADSKDPVEIMSVKSTLLERELELIRNAVFTEPDDQTSWWYFRFILDWANPKNDTECDNAALEEFQTILLDEYYAIQELVESEGGQCKWGLLGLHMIANTFCSIEESNQFGGEDWEGLFNDCLNQLKILDPDRIRRYDTLLKNKEP